MREVSRRQRWRRWSQCQAGPRSPGPRGSTRVVGQEAPFPPSWTAPEADPGVPFRAGPSPFAANCGDLEGCITQASLFAETVWSDAGVWWVVQALAVSLSPAREGSAPGVLAPPTPSPSPAPSPALEAYEALAPFSDAYTAGYAHDPWLGRRGGWAPRCGRP